MHALAVRTGIGSAAIAVLFALPSTASAAVYDNAVTAAATVSGNTVTTTFTNNYTEQIGCIVVGTANPPGDPAAPGAVKFGADPNSTDPSTVGVVVNPGTTASFVNNNVPDGQYLVHWLCVSTEEAVPGELEVWTTFQFLNRAPNRMAIPITVPNNSLCFGSVCLPSGFGL